MIISTEWHGVKAVSTGFFQAGPFNLSSLAAFLVLPAKAVAPKVEPLAFTIAMALGYTEAQAAALVEIQEEGHAQPCKEDAGEEAKVTLKTTQKRALSFSAYGEEPAYTEPEVKYLPVYGPVTSLASHFLAMVGMEAGTSRDKARSALFTRFDRRTMGSLVEEDITIFYAGEDCPEFNPATVLLEGGKDSGQTVPIPGNWVPSHTKTCLGIWRFVEPKVTSTVALGKTVMPYGRMRIFPRDCGSEAHIDPWVKGEYPVLGYVGEGKSLGDILSRHWPITDYDRQSGVPESWRDALDMLDWQWDNQGEDAKGVLVPVKGLPIDVLKREWLDSQIPFMRGELRQKVRHYLRLTASKKEVFTFEEPGKAAVKEFERTSSGHWDSHDTFISTGCSEGHMLSLGWRREFTQVLRCEDSRGYRLAPKKARALAQAAERLHGEPCDWIQKAAQEIAVNHEEFDDRPIDGGVEYRDGTQVNRFADKSYEEELEDFLEDAGGEGEFDVEDDFEDFEYSDNVIAWQDEYEDLTRKEYQDKPASRLPANSPLQVWYSALRLADKFNRLAERSQLPDAKAAELREEFDALKEETRHNQRLLKACFDTTLLEKPVVLWQGKELPTTEWIGRFHGKLECATATFETRLDEVNSKYTYVHTSYQWGRVGTDAYRIVSGVPQGKLLDLVLAARDQADTAIKEVEGGRLLNRMVMVLDALTRQPKLARILRQSSPGVLAFIKKHHSDVWKMLPGDVRKGTLPAEPKDGAKVKAELHLRTLSGVKRMSKAKLMLRDITEYLTEELRKHCQ